MQYKTLTFEEKVAAIREVEKGVKKKAQIAKDFQIPPNTLSTYLKKNKERILNSIKKIGKTEKGQEDRKIVKLTGVCQNVSSKHGTSRRGITFL